eukprot:657431-Lingulodinium_polyedra.AAC.1
MNGACKEHDESMNISRQDHGQHAMSMSRAWNDHGQSKTQHAQRVARAIRPREHSMIRAGTSRQEHARSMRRA